MRPTLNAVQLTALLTAFWRHCEFKTGARLCKDPFAGVLLDELLPDERRSQFEKSPLFNAGLEILACRTRAIDDWLLDCGSEGMSEQVVLLGAGMDTRAYRLALGKATKVFEVETDIAVLRAKHAALKRRGISPSVEVIEVEADVTDAATLSRRLAKSGLDAGKRTSWVAEGLLEYLPPAAQSPLFAAMREITGEGAARVGMQVLEPSFGQFVSAKGVGLPYQELRSVEHTTEALQRHGWEIERVWDQAQFQRAFGRAPHAGFRLVFGKLAHGR